MPLQLSVGISKKVGQPHFGSLGASCAITRELDSRLLETDPQALQAEIQAVYEVCRDAVTAELSQQEASPTSIKGQDAVQACSMGTAGLCPRQPRQATPAQRRLLTRLAAARHIDVVHVIADRHGVGSIESLSVSQASQLIEELRGTPADA